MSHFYKNILLYIRGSLTYKKGENYEKGFIGYISFNKIITPLFATNSAFAEIKSEKFITGNLYGSPINFEFDRTSGVLCIFGEGKMSDFSSEYMSNDGEYGFGWTYHDWCDEIQSVVIEEGVEDIIGSCFQYCENLKTVTIPSTVKTIGGPYCFDKCSNFTDIYYNSSCSDFQNIVIVKSWGVTYKNNKEFADKYNVAVHFINEKSGWHDEGNKRYYLDEELTLLYGLNEIGEKNYIFSKTTGELLYGKVRCDGKQYIMSKSNGEMLYGLVRCDGKYYVMNKSTGEMCYGKVSCNGKQYIMSKSNGQMLYGKVTCDGNAYICSKSDGHIFTNMNVTCNGVKYHCDSTGIATRR